MPNIHFRFIPPVGANLGDIQYPPLPHEAVLPVMLELKRGMLAALKMEPGKRMFETVVKAIVGEHAVGLRFIPKVDTAAAIFWGRPKGEGVPVDVLGVTFYLTGTDIEAERKMIDQAASMGMMKGLNPHGITAAKDGPRPQAITLFATEDAAKDGLLHALVEPSAAAYFDQFGLIDNRKQIMMKFKGLIFLPQADTEKFVPQEMVLPQEQGQQMFRDFRESVQTGTGFVITIGLGDTDERPITIRFSHVGLTSAFALLSYDVADQPKHIHGLVALLPKLNADEDRQTITHIRKFAALRAIPQNAFDSVLKFDEPVVASFFADMGSANYPPLHSVIKVLGAAFFSQFSFGMDDGEVDEVERGEAWNAGKSN